MTVAIDDVLDFVALSPRQFSVLRSLTVSQSFGASDVYEQQLALVLAQDVNDETECLYLEFDGARNLKLCQSDLSVIDMHLQIHDGSAVSDVHSKFFVSDGEMEEVIRFECRTFEAYIASKS